MILYAGNKLSKYGNTPTSVETLGEQLKESFEVVTVSDKRNKAVRLMHMLWNIVRYRGETSYLLIDTYSTLNFYYALACAALARGLGIAYVPILHGGDLPRRLQRNRRMSAFIFAHAHVNVAPSGYLQEAFKSHGYETVFIPNNVKVSDYAFTPRESIRPKLLYVRAFSTLYNPQLALDVLAVLLQKHPDAELCMVGPDRDGTLERTKQKCKAMGLDAHVRFTGKMDKQAWTALSKEYDVFINTTNFDNTPVSVIEAMALGLPVVTTNVGGIPYLVENGVDALTVPAGDAAAMSAAVERLLDEQDFAAGLARNARKKAERFDWDGGVKKQWTDLLNGADKNVVV